MNHTVLETMHLVTMILCTENSAVEDYGHNDQNN